MSVMDRQNRTQWFSQLSESLGITQDAVFNLLVESKIEEHRFHQIRDATICYIRACLGNPSNTEGGQALLEMAMSKLANRTPNGLLLPKQEFQIEFNQLHKAIVSWLRDLGIDDLIYSLIAPIPVRLVRGQRNLREEARPYSSSKLHSDGWADCPFDSIAIHIPILGDIERTNTEFYHPPEDFEARYLRVLGNYDEAKELEGRCEKYPVCMRLGSAYFADCLALHKTVKKQGGARVTIQVILRRATTDAERRQAGALCSPGHLSHYIDRNEWYKYGTAKFMRFKDTYADAEKGNFTKRPYDEPTYDVVDRL